MFGLFFFPPACLPFWKCGTVALKKRKKKNKKRWPSHLIRQIFHAYPWTPEDLAGRDGRPLNLCGYRAATSLQNAPVVEPMPLRKGGVGEGR